MKQKMQKLHGFHIPKMCIVLDDFMKYKPLISEECDAIKKDNWEKPVR